MTKCVATAVMRNSVSCRTSGDTVWSMNASFGLTNQFSTIAPVPDRSQEVVPLPETYYLASLPAGADLRSLAATIKARWICEQAHQQLKEELGLDHFEGRSWHGLHRHALMTMIAYAFLQNRRLAKAKRGKKNRRTTASTKPASGPSRHRQSHASIASAMPALPKMAQRRAA